MTPWPKHNGPFMGLLVASPRPLPYPPSGSAWWALLPSWEKEPLTRWGLWEHQETLLDPTPPSSLSTALGPQSPPP